MKKTLVGMLSLLAIFAMTTFNHAAESQPVRPVQVPQQEHGYSTFEGTVLKTQAELDDFLKLATTESGWNDSAKFQKALKEAKLDFTKESLVLIRLDEGSGSVRLTPRDPVLKDKKIIYSIDRVAPEIGTADMAFHCFALAVAKDAATEVEVQVKGKPPITIPLK